MPIRVPLALGSVLRAPCCRSPRYLAGMAVVSLIPSSSATTATAWLSPFNKLPPSSPSPSPHHPTRLNSLLSTPKAALHHRRFPSQPASPARVNSPAQLCEPHFFRFVPAPPPPLPSCVPASGLPSGHSPLIPLPAHKRRPSSSSPAGLSPDPSPSATDLIHFCASVTSGRHHDRTPQQGRLRRPRALILSAHQGREGPPENELQCGRGYEHQ